MSNRFASILRPAALLPILLCAAAAVAAEESKSSEQSLEVVQWSGIHAGLHGGYGRGRTAWIFPSSGYFNLLPGDRFAIEPEGGLIGGHLLVSRQFGRFVLGVEAAYGRSTLTAARYGAVTPIFPLDRFQTDVEDMASVSGRLGYVLGRWQLYAKAGWANAEITQHALSGPPGAGVIASVGGRRNGGVFGGGAEYRLTPDVSVGLQYDFARFGSDDHASTTTGTPPPQPFNLRGDDVDLHTLTARLSLRLGGDWHRVEGP